jgi:uncharacterized protein (TIGR00730 family)
LQTDNFEGNFAMTNKIKSIAVFCGSAMGKNQAIIDCANELGQTLAQREIALVYGGASVGIMGVVADAAMNNNGHVVGIIPSFFSKTEIAHNGLTELIFVESMAQRKELLAERSDAFIILPGGFGTLDEMFEMLTMSQLNMHQKSVGVLNINGFYDHLIKQLEVMNREGFLRDNHYQMFVFDHTIDGLLQKMESHQISQEQEWLNWAKE